MGSDLQQLLVGERQDALKDDHVGTVHCFLRGTRGKKLFETVEPSRHACRVAMIRSERGRSQHQVGGRGVATNLVKSVGSQEEEEEEPRLR